MSLVIFLLNYDMSARMSLSLRPPADAPPLAALQTGGVEMPEYCSWAKPPQGTYITGPAHPRECDVLIALLCPRGISFLLLLLDGFKPFQYPL